MQTRIRRRAAGAVLAVLVADRAPARAWANCLVAGSLTLVVGFGWQAGASGWPALWRGYTGYDMIAEGRFWGASIGARRWLASVACFWLALAGRCWLGRRRRRAGPLRYAVAACPRPRGGDHHSGRVGARTSMAIRFIVRAGAEAYSG